MKNVALFATLGLLMMVYVNADSAPSNSQDNDESTIKIYKRLIPADVLRGNRTRMTIFCKEVPLLGIILNFLLLRPEQIAPN